ncbi:hypothetical protein GB931_07380 [Modestobacter sp. I12A-02628]|uniref:Ig-like domain-containing protein n=1 Tax=Goekera deserti TaxID=2497753 RepID=A0A7K3WJU9_9ACTN|nr:hypothetical protein [Goekera deserti]MPQ97744.1 hypothetical protein [Goekera deserti]NDI48389.1 hypothetical protein [Goekera deserti]NEL55990.1 hypothetical protein [Goekera deserti]
MSSSVQLRPLPPAEPARPGRRRRTERLLTAVLVAAVLIAGWARRWTADDAFITFRVVANVLGGAGPVFNAGERVEVATSPLWLAVLTVAEAVVPGDAVAWSSVLLGLALTAAGVGLATRAGHRLLARTPARLAVPLGMVVFAALPPVWDFTTSGLETGLAFGWLGACWWGLVRWAGTGARTRTGAGAPSVLGQRWLLVLLGTGPLVRPDLAVVGVVLLGWLVLSGAGRWWQRVAALAVAGALPVAVEVLRAGYYGLLVPNTAVAKESGRALWGRGAGYLGDLVGPHLLWLPLLVGAGLVAVLARGVVLRRREVSLLLAAVLAAVAHALYVVRVGGDFMHGRLLLPSLFLLLCPVAVVPLTRDRLRAVTALLAVGALWALASVAVLRPGYDGGQVSGTGIADERGHYVRQAGTGHPVTLADHGGTGVLAYTDRVLALAGTDVVVAQPPPPVTVDTPLRRLAPSSGGLVFSVGNAGFYGVAVGTGVRVVDVYGLTDPVAAHLEAPPPGRPGHEKRLPAAWLLARYGSPELARVSGPGLPDAADVAAARVALTCGAAAELVEATSAPLSWTRFVDNVLGAPARTSLRIPTDPQQAEAALC